MCAMRTNMLSSWETFIQRHELQAQVPAWIANSWERCRMLLTPHQPLRLHYLKESLLLTEQIRNFDLLSVARPIMEDIYQYVEGTQTNIFLTNSAGYVLEAIGDAGVIDNGIHPSSLQGISLSEAKVGTNAFGLCLIERVPFSVHGAEHFLLAFHHFADASAPIFDINGKLLGALGMLTNVENYHSYALGMCVAGARAIEAQRQSDQLLAGQNAHLARLNAIIDNIAEGILVWNADGVILHANPSAADLLNISRHHLMGNLLESYLRFPDFILQSINEHRPLDNVEVEFLAAGEPLTCMISLRFVHLQIQTQVVIAILRSLSSVRKLVQQQTVGQMGFSFTDLAGHSSAIERVRRLAKTAAAAHGPVLLRGETGTGKNLLARAIHHHSSRRDDPFLLYTCKTVPAELSLADLIGYARNFFKDHPEGRPSKFELADGGTLFIQNVDALPLEAQNALLNYLELGFVQRLGSQRPIQVNVRVLASSSTPLEKKVAEGCLLPDLYYCLSAFEICLPALRDRRADLPDLAEQILCRLRRQYHISYKLHPETIDCLQRYTWPGNVRELETVLTRTVIQANQQTLITPDHLPPAIRHGLNLVNVDMGVLETEPISFKQAEREAVLKAAQACCGNVTQMARMLGVGRTTVWRRVREFDIPLKKFRQQNTTK